MKISWMALFVLTACLWMAGCNGGPFCMSPKGPNVTQTIALPDFEGIDLAIASDVTIHKGDVQTVTVTGAQNIIDNLERNVSGGIWEIRFDECVRNEGNLHIDITIPNLSQAAIAGSGSITSNDTFGGLDNLLVSIAGSGSIDILANAAHVESSIAGSGDIHLYTEATDVTANIAGSGDIFLKGTSTNVDAKITGSGNIHAFDLAAQNGVVTITGSGDCEINASENLEVNITGSGNVRYKGTPRIDFNSSGSGTIKHVD